MNEQDKGRQEWAFEDATQTAKKIRLALKHFFPDCKFSVTTSKYSGGCSVSIGYTDGPASALVEQVTNAFTRTTFDGMTDSMDYEAYSYDGQRFMGADFINVHRSFTAENELTAQEFVAAKYGILWDRKKEAHEITVPKSDDGCTWSNLAMTAIRELEKISFDADGTPWPISDPRNLPLNRAAIVEAAPIAMTTTEPTTDDDNEAGATVYEFKPKAAPAPATIEDDMSAAAVKEFLTAPARTPADDLLDAVDEHCKQKLIEYGKAVETMVAGLQAEMTKGFELVAACLSDLRAKNAELVECVEQDERDLAAMGREIAALKIVKASEKKPENQRQIFALKM
jgi:hypothetical protein